MYVYTISIYIYTRCIYIYIDRYIHISSLGSDRDDMIHSSFFLDGGLYAIIMYYPEFTWDERLSLGCSPSPRVQGRCHMFSPMKSRFLWIFTSTHHQITMKSASNHHWILKSPWNHPELTLNPLISPDFPRCSRYGFRGYTRIPVDEVALSDPLSKSPLLEVKGGRLAQERGQNILGGSSHLVNGL